MNRTTCFTFGLILLAGTIGHPVRAEDTKTVLAEELMTVSGVRRGIETSLNMFRTMAEQQINKQEQTPSAATTEQNKKFVEWLDKEISWDTIKAKYVAVYADTFSESEMKDLIAFFKSPIGKTFAEKQVVLAPQLGKLNRELIMGIPARIQQAKSELATDKPAVIKAPADNRKPVKLDSPARP